MFVNVVMMNVKVLLIIVLFIEVFEIILVYLYDFKGEKG